MAIPNQRILILVSLHWPLRIVKLAACLSQRSTNSCGKSAFQSFYLTKLKYSCVQSVLAKYFFKIETYVNWCTVVKTRHIHYHDQEYKYFSVSKIIKLFKFKKA